MNWLQTARGYDEASACVKVSDEFNDGPCGPVCDPRTCNPPTFPPTKPPTPSVTYCGCDSCTQEVYDSPATDSGGTFTCGARINWLRTVRGYDESRACAKISDEFVDGPCGPHCHPSRCGLPAQTPTTPPTKIPTPSPSLAPSKKPTNEPTNAPSRNPTFSPSKKVTLAPSTPNQMCGCTSCTEDVLDSLADGHTCRGRIDWVVGNYGYSEADACKFVGDEYPSICGKCHTGKCGLTSPTPSPNSSQDQKCGGAVDFTRDSSQTCQTYLWDPTTDRSMHCFAYGGSSDPCHLNNNNDSFDGIYKDPSACLDDTFYLWDEPDTQGRDYSWAGTTWLEYSKRFSQEIEQMKSRGTKVTGPLLKAGTAGVIEQNMRTFFNACGPACSDPTDPAYIDVVAINGFCGPWNKDAGCRGGAKFIYNEAVSVSVASNNIPVYITNWSRLETADPFDQVDAINSIDEFFPSSSVVHRVYWFGARDYGGGSGTTSYLTNTLPDGRTLGEVWRAKCDSI